MIEGLSRRMAVVMPALAKNKTLSEKQPTSKKG
jgi:hypothetical protein